MEESSITKFLKKDSLLSLTVKKSKSANGIVTDKKVDCVAHFLQYLPVCGYTKCIRDNHLLACNYAKYLPIFIFFTVRLSNKPFFIWLGLLTTPPHIHYVVTLPCNISLIACFLLTLCFTR